jgi:hypothetical protein
MCAMMNRQRSAALFHRRAMRTGAGALGFASLPILARARQTEPKAGTSARLIAGTRCPVTPEQTEGPFYFDPRLVRADLAEDKAG